MRRAWLPLAAAAAILLVIAASLILQPGPIEPEPVARLTHISVDSGAWEKSETQVVLGMTQVAAKPGERRSMRLATGVIVFLNENTALEVRSASVLRLRSGEIYVDTAGRKADTSKGEEVLLRVETDHAATVVTGTRFGVSANERQTSVTVEEGAVTVESAWGEQLVVGGNVFRVIESLEPEPPAPVDLERTLAWIAERPHLAEMSADSSGAGRERLQLSEVPSAKRPAGDRGASDKMRSADPGRPDLNFMRTVPQRRQRKNVW